MARRYLQLRRSRGEGYAMTLREKVAHLIRSRGQQFYNDWHTNDDEFRYHASNDMADAILALLSTADSEQREVADLRRKLSSLSLANAQWKAWAEQFVKEYVVCPDDDAVVCSHLEGERTRVSKLLALPADGLAQEVVKYMVHMLDCDDKCICGLDALLEKLGGPK